MKNFLEYADNALKGILFIGSSVGNVDGNEEIWNIKLSNRTYQVYAHSLLMVYYLTEAYNNTGDRKYINKAQSYLLSWIRKEHKSKYLWHEYSTLSRLKYTLFFINSYKNNSIRSTDLTNLLKQHLNFLMDDKNYKKNNHGIMIDNALISSVAGLPEELKHIKAEIEEKVIERSQNAIKRDFSTRGIHLENSPDYHRLTVKWLLHIEEKLNVENKSLGEKYVQKLKLSKSLDSIIVMPNNRYPIYGDSSDGRFQEQKNFEDFIDEEAGRAIFHNKNLHSQLTFISGYGRKGHKHFDDLSFIFHDGKQVIFNDSGKYNYEKSNPIRKHLISPLAHNSLSVYKENYLISEIQDIKNKVFISKYLITENYKLIQGINNSYSGITLKRTLLFFCDNSILIFDQFSSDNVNTIAVNFNLGLDVTVNKISRTEYHIEGDKKYILKSHISPFTSVLLEDKYNTICKISNKFGKSEPNYRILLRLKTKKGAFLTTIEPEKSQLEIIGVEDNTVSLVFEDQSMKINLS